VGEPTAIRLKPQPALSFPLTLHPQPAGLLGKPLADKIRPLLKKKHNMVSRREYAQKTDNALIFLRQTW
jgi:hypothetical protein